MTNLREVQIAALPPERYEAIVRAEAAELFRAVEARSPQQFKGRTVWTVNSTESGGGVAELLRSLVAYARGGGVDVRWLVISGNDDFFEVTKRIHNNLHDYAGDGGGLGEAERLAYESALAPNLADLGRLARPGDLVLLHDPQTAGLVPGLKKLGLLVTWRCHVGIDGATDTIRRAWSFLSPYVTGADALVFSRRSFVWEGLDPARTVVIAPSIDAFSPKNHDLAPGAVPAILATAGLVAGTATAQAGYTRQDGSQGVVRRRAEVYESEPLTPGTPTVVQVSRWDHLKDPLGVIRGFTDFVGPFSDAHLVYAGPAVSAVRDDPEGGRVLASAIATWRALPPAQQRRVHLACLPMDDWEENATIVNALQRHARVVVQKSLAEGFGLTVAEAMWKGRPTVASRIGGIQDIIEDGVSGILLDDPADLRAYGNAVLSVLSDPARAERLGTAARERIRDQFLGARSLLQYFELFTRLLGA